MKLSRYLELMKITDDEFAKRINVSRVSVNRYRNGRRRPNWNEMARIITETEGMVSFKDFEDAPSPAGGG